MQIRIRKPSPLTLAFIVCGIVWTYLAMTSQMAIMHDSEGYQKLGYLLQEDGFLAYFKTGPRREPLYPLFISWCISLSKILNVSYKSILIIGQFLILGITQWLMQKVLQLFQIDKRIQAGVLIYFGLSAAMITSALRLYSEIVTYPFIVLAVLLSCRLLGVIIQENNTLKKTIKQNIENMKLVISLLLYINILI